MNILFNKTKVKIIVLWLLVLLWMLFIFCMSAQEADVSQSNSNFFVEKIISIFIKDFESFEEGTKNEIVAFLSTLIRKGAHLTEYFILGTLLFFAVNQHNLKNKIIKKIAPLAIGSLYAASDEIHQLFVKGRAAMLSDVLLDSIGVALAIIVFSFIMFILHRNKTKTKKNYK